MPEPRKLRVFICHASQDKPVVRELYQRLLAEQWIAPWLDEENLLPGQDWDMEIEKAVDGSEAVVVCLSENSVTKEGYVQKEIKNALDKAEEKPEETIFVIPLRFDDSSIPRRFKKWQYINYFPPDARDLSYERLLQSLDLRLKGIARKDAVSLGQLPVENHFSLFEMLAVGLLSGMIAISLVTLLTFGLCGWVGSLVGGFVASYVLLRRRRIISKSEGVRLGKAVGIVSGIPTFFTIPVQFFLIYLNRSQLAQSSLYENMTVVGIWGIGLIVCTGGIMSIVLGWVGGLLGSHYFASRWK